MDEHVEFIGEVGGMRRQDGADIGGEDSVKAARTVLSRMIGEDHVVDGRLDAD